LRSTVKHAIPAMKANNPGGHTVGKFPYSTSPIALCLSALLAGAVCSCTGGEPVPSDDADPARGKALVQQIGCGSCHQIPGIASAQGEVGPPLDKLARRAYLAGILPNNFDNLVLWITQPQSVAPDSAMPDLGLNDAQAQDIAAYLYTLQ
jgi:cytochrome c